MRCWQLLLQPVICSVAEHMCYCSAHVLCCRVSTLCCAVLYTQPTFLDPLLLPLLPLFQGDTASPSKAVSVLKPLCCIAWPGNPAVAESDSSRVSLHARQHCLVQPGSQLFCTLLFGMPRWVYVRGCLGVYRVW